MLRLRKRTLLVALAALPFAAPAIAQNRTTTEGPQAGQADWPIDPKTAVRVLDFLNGNITAQDIVDEVGVSEVTAIQIMNLKGGSNPSGVPGLGTFDTLYDLNPIWSNDHDAWSLFDSRFGPRRYGRWDMMPYLFPISPVNSALTYTGRVLVIDENGSTSTTQWDYSDRQNGIFITPNAPPNISLWCAHSIGLSDGRILVAGGGGGGPNVNSDQAHIFDPVGGVQGQGGWTQINDLNFERWYPTEVALGYPYTLIVGGVNGFNATISKLEIYDEAADTFTIVQGNGADLFWPPTYPGLHPLPDGKIVFTRTGFIGNPNSPPTQYLEFNDWNNPIAGGNWNDLGSMDYQDRVDGISMMFLEPDETIFEYKAKVAVFGGGYSLAAARDTAEILDCENLLPGKNWRRLPDMVEDRHHCQGAILPTGEALLWGGVNNHFDIGGNGSFTSEIFDPCSETFTTTDSLTYDRGYHSVSALLPTGEVMASGGRGFPPESTDRSIEVFKPPYFFQGKRPEITGHPATVAHGAQFDIVTPDAKNVGKVMLVRPVNYSHQTDSDQRAIPLKFTIDAANGKVIATTPNGIARHPVAPHGYYLLFILDCDDIPSEGKFIRLG